MAASNSKKTAQKKNRTDAQAKKTADNKPNRPPVATRTPLEQLAQICAQRANNTRGLAQHEWFALGSWVSQYRPQMEQTAQAEPARTMTAAN